MPNACLCNYGCFHFYILRCKQLLFIVIVTSKSNKKYDSIKDRNVLLITAKVPFDEIPLIVEMEHTLSVSALKIADVNHYREILHRKATCS